MGCWLTNYLITKGVGITFTKLRTYFHWIGSQDLSNYDSHPSLSRLRWSKFVFDPYLAAKPFLAFHLIVRRMSSGVNFIIVLRATFMHADTKSAKKTVKLSSFFALLGSVSLKAARRTLVKLTLGFNFINMLTSNFYLRRLQKRKKTVKSSVEKKLTYLLCCCTSADLRFTLCTQVWWN